ncbi:SlyX family protein [Litorilituus sediminis]|uniref:Protein SlyX homolog n=1 Tax=Litorilituus sediminis TaxID=718192 RepID=A0A4P6P8S7_9GAMM|nr:SlyX family protein [Litorilituus sediminis]QBG35897.1 SlyX family protein [Litorilituus sediminis]
MANAEISLTAHSNNDNYIKQLEERVDALESRNVFQDDVIEQLSQELAVHQSEITELKEQIQIVASRLKEAGNLSSKEQVEPPPPHY